MMRALPAKPSKASVVTAVVFAFFTLLIFTLLTNYGPESTLKRFFEYAANDQIDGLQGLVLITSPGKISAQEGSLLQEVHQFTHQGAYHIVQVVTQPGQHIAVAEVVWDVPSNPPIRDTWVLTRFQYHWMVNLSETAKSRMF